MDKVTGQELRSRFVKFFQQRGHRLVPYSSLVPENDSTTLFTGSGMQPMIPYLLGEPHPEGKRVVDFQKSFRSQDIEEVGDNRHTTFFEMLGNWSFGDYFREQQIQWIFEFLTVEAGLDPHNLYVSAFRGDTELELPRDEEAAAVWKKLFTESGIPAKVVDFPERDGLQGGRIFYYGHDKNWWSRSATIHEMPVGEPGGPSSEMFWDFGEHLALHEQSKFRDLPCHVNCDCGRFFEIGNNVFMTYLKTETGFELMAQRNIDFGGGLERILAAAHNDQDMFQIDLLRPLVAIVEKLTGRTYGENGEDTRAFQVIADHVRAAVFLVLDGVEPGNKERGYVLRRLLRRAMVYAKLMDTQDGWLSECVEAVISIYKGTYQELATRGATILSTIELEHKKFDATLERGLKEFQKLRTITGKDAFNLFQSFGIPWEITHELALRRGMDVDYTEFKSEFSKHQELSRTSSAGTFKGGLADHSEKAVRYHTATHLLQAALRKVLGGSILQRGSNISSERMRFDFTHDAKMTTEQIAEVQELINTWVQRDLSVKKEVMPQAEARELGALGVFGEKYGDVVSVYTIYDQKTGEVVSREFCGGPHVQHTAEIGKFKIVKEEAVSAGTRRIKAVLVGE